MAHVQDAPLIEGGADATADIVEAKGSVRRPADFAANQDFRPLIEFTGSGWGLLKIYLLNGLNMAFTLGVYAFWGRVNVRRYLWENTRVLGDPLEYTGTGGELFRGFLLSALIVAPVLAVGYGLSMLAHPAASLFFFILFLPVTHYAVYQASRYRLTRTRWRGIRGNLDGSAFDYAKAGVLYSLLTIVSLGACHPLATARLDSRLANNARFGSRNMSFFGGSRPLFRAWVACVGGSAFVILLHVGAILLRSQGAELGGGDLAASLLPFSVMAVVFVGGLCFRAARTRWFWGNLSYGDMRFNASRYTPGGLLWVTASNLFLIFVSAGVYYPWAKIRFVKYFLNALDYAGDPDPATIGRDETPEKSRGEGLADVLDVDLAF